MTKLLTVGCFMYTCVSLAYTFILKGVYKLFLIPVLFVFCPIFWFMIKTTFHDWLKHEKKLKAIKKSKAKTNQYDAKYYATIVEPYYVKGKGLYNQMLKGGYLRGNDLKSIYELVFDELGNSYTYYEDYEFKSLPHKTYVLMKDKNITKDGWERIINYLEDIKKDSIPISIAK